MIAANEAELEELLSRPTPGAVKAMAEMAGDLLILGVGGKMGPSLARLARRAADDAGRRDLKVIGVSRFSDERLVRELTESGVEAVRCDLLDEAARRRLPDAPNVLSMLGHKFGKGQPASLLWAMNVYLPGVLAEQFCRSRIVAFSSGNVYSFTRIDEPAPTESTPCAPVGEYAITAWGRERLYEHVANRHGTPTCLLRLNYAVEARYGVLVDIAQQILAGEPIDLATPSVNLVWQGYANAVALQSFALATSPAHVLNLTGLGNLRVRDLAHGLGKRLGREPRFNEPEGDTALLNDASRCHELFGPPQVGVEEVMDLVAGWLTRGGRTLGKPTKFQVRDGKF